MDSQPKAGPDPREPLHQCQRCHGKGELPQCSCFMYDCGEWGDPAWAQSCPTLRQVPCPDCKGRGFTRHLDASGNYDQEECHECDGTGEITDDSGGNIGVVKHCTGCNGTGIYQGKDSNDVGPCFWCHGKRKKNKMTWPTPESLQAEINELRHRVSSLEQKADYQPDPMDREGALSLIESILLILSRRSWCGYSNPTGEYLDSHDFREILLLLQDLQKKLY